jgi:hypothetical protein
MQAVITTFRKLRVNPLDLKVDDINVEDIGHSLALCNRFAGHTRAPISVAQHSYFVSRLCEPFGVLVALQGLLHDGSEAYLGDVTKWLKGTPEMKGYRDAEERVQEAVFIRFLLPTELHPAVEAADRLMVRYEGYVGYGPEFTIEHPDYPPVTKAEVEELTSLGWAFWDWRQSRQKFLDQYYKLWAERNAA